MSAAPIQPRLIIVQDKPTQFDAPFYAFATRQARFDLKVYYTFEPHDRGSVADPEIGRAPLWDHLSDCAYPVSDPMVGDTDPLARLTQDIVRQRPNLVILCGYYPPLHARLAWRLKRAGVRIGLRSDNTLQHSRFHGVKGAIKHLVLPYWLKRYDTWHPVGTLAQRYLETTARTRKPTFLFPYSVDNDWFAAGSARYRLQREFLRAGMAMSSADFVILGILKWHPREDPITLLDAVARLRERRPTAKLVLVGDGPLREAVRAKAAHLDDGVYLPGYVAYSELPRYYAASDVFVHPAVDEPWGVSVNEAMACGLPVVAASGVGAGADLIANGETGFMFPNGDSAALCERLLLLMDDRELRLRMGQAAGRRITEWSYQRTLQDMIGALE